MSWLNKLLPPKIKRQRGPQRRGALPEGLWSKRASCEAVLYATDLENNLQVCPKCGHHNRLNARQRIDLLLDAEGRSEIGAEVVPVDSLKFRDSKRYPDRLMEANSDTGESDSLVVLQGAIKTMPVVAAAFDRQGALSRRRHHVERAEVLGDRPGQAESVQAGGRQHHCVQILADASQPGIDVAANVGHPQVWTGQCQLRRPAG